MTKLSSMAKSPKVLKAFAVTLWVSAVLSFLFVLNSSNPTQTMLELDDVEIESEPAIELKQLSAPQTICNRSQTLFFLNWDQKVGINPWGPLNYTSTKAELEHSKCRHTNCVFTNQKGTLANFADFNAIFFDLLGKKSVDLPEKRSPCQFYVMMSKE
jgi:hypothetical protein